MLNPSKTGSRWHWSLPLLLIPLIGCSTPPGAPAPSSDRAAILAAGRAFSAAYVANDTAALARVYTEDAVLLPPGREVRGRQAIAAYFAWGPRYRQLAHSMTTADLHISGDLAVDVGTWSSTSQRGDNPAVTASERYLVVWSRQPDGQWRIVYDMWHRPAPAP